MPVHERLMQPGSFSIQLQPEIPPGLWGAILGAGEHLYGHIIIHPVQRYPEEQLIADDVAVRNTAQYMGVLRSVDEDFFVLNGAGMNIWLGDEDGKGPIYETAIELTDGSLSDWVSALLPAGYPIQPGTIHTGNTSRGPLSWQTIYTTPREALSTVVDWFQSEWRINRDGTLDAGTPIQLYGDDPTNIVTKVSSPESNEPGDSSVGGFGAPEFVSEIDVEDYVTKVIAITQGFGFDISVGTATRSTNYRDIFGQLIEWKKRHDVSELELEHADGIAETELNRSGVNRRVILGTDTYLFPVLVEIGDFVYVYDPSRLVFDTNNEVFYNGQPIYPKKQRVFAYDWAIEEGMGVYYRFYNTSGDLQYFDLSPFVEYETDVTGLDVGPMVPQHFDRERFRPTF